VEIPDTKEIKKRKKGPGISHGPFFLLMWEDVGRVKKIAVVKYRPNRRRVADKNEENDQRGSKIASRQYKSKQWGGGLQQSPKSRAGSLRSPIKCGQVNHFAVKSETGASVNHRAWGEELRKR